MFKILKMFLIWFILTIVLKFFFLKYIFLVNLIKMDTLCEFLLLVDSLSPIE